jgi:hypothetical protein
MGSTGASGTAGGGLRDPRFAALVVEPGFTGLIARADEALCGITEHLRTVAL